MLWSRRTIFMVLVVGAPVALAIAIVLLQASGFLPGSGMSRAAIFGMLIWVLYLRFIVPVLGVFYGTSLIADEIEDRTLTYLFTRPIPRGAVLVGKYLAYLVCTVLVVLPSVVVVYFTLVPFREVPASFLQLLGDVGILALGLAVYGGLFALMGAGLNRPLVIGLVFAFGWEQVVLLLPGYLKQWTVAYYLQALVPHTMPSGGPASMLQSLFRDTMHPVAAVACLLIELAIFLVLAVRVVNRREYVLDQ